jgi:predicted neutral ceramidase superfamily lipid hydrolase|tara:strand:+ start:5631 stop:5849 length:219 start_codon:yes stop_codon:yes gene_type:complete
MLSQICNVRNLRTITRTSEFIKIAEVIVKKWKNFGARSYSIIENFRAAISAKNKSINNQFKFVKKNYKISKK